jgi:hypothetical protein
MAEINLAEANEATEIGAAAFASRAVSLGGAAERTISKGSADRNPTGDEDGDADIAPAVSSLDGEPPQVVELQLRVAALKDELNEMRALHARDAKVRDVE